MPPALLNKLHMAAVTVTQRQHVQEMFVKVSIPMTVSNASKEFKEYLDGVNKRWARIIKENNIKMY